MNSPSGLPSLSLAARAVYGALDPVPLGCFVAAWIFDLARQGNGELLWNKSAAWLIALGWLFAVIPRLINLVHLWFTDRPAATGPEKLDLRLKLLATVAAVFNAFVHSRDGHAVVPEGAWPFVGVGLAWDQRGAMLIADDVGNTVWRVTAAAP
jgi:uncharacterized membrane protein